MQTLESLRDRVNSIEDLQSVVKTMKALAAVSIRQYERAVESLIGYDRTLELGLQIALREKPGVMVAIESKPAKRLGAIVFGSDQGMVGQFNQVIANHAINEIDQFGIEQKDRTILAVGLRAASRLEQNGQPVAERLTVPGGITGITPMVQEMVVSIEAWRRQGIERITLFHNKSDSRASYHPQTLQLLPLDPKWVQNLEKREWPTHVLPTFNLEWNRLFAALIREYLFVSIFRAFTESLASENSSRLAAMQAAEKNIEERLARLNAEYHNVRQASITEELLDVVAGFELLQNAEG